MLLLLLLVTGVILAQSGNPLSGVYTVNPNVASSSTNYQTINAIVSDLISNGVSGYVVINLTDTIFNEQFYLHDVPGVSAVNSITIQSDPTNTGNPLIQFSATTALSNYVIKLENIKYLRIRGITIHAKGVNFGRALLFAGKVKHTVIENDTIKSTPYATTGRFNTVYMEQAARTTLNPNPENDSIVVRKNIVIGGYTGIAIGGGWSGESTSLDIRANKVSNWYSSGIHLYESEDSYVDSNLVIISTPSKSFSQALALSECDDAVVQGNIVRGLSQGHLRSIYTYRCQRIKILNNSIYTESKSLNFGLDLECDGNGPSYSSSNVIMNNAISIAADTLAVGLLADIDLTVIVNNSIAVFNAIESRSFHYDNNSGSYNQVYNNSFANFAGGLSVYLEDNGGLDSMNFNNLYSNGRNLALVWINRSASLAEWVSISGFDSHSRSVNPLYYSYNDLHATGLGLNNGAKVHSFVNYDIDGESRSSVSPDIGFDEFIPLSCQPPILLNTPSENVYYDSISFSWSTGIATYDIMFDQGLFMLGSGHRDTTVQDTSFSLSNLTPNTLYCFYIKKHCGLSDSSIWAGPYLIRTACKVSAPFFEEFNDIEVPDCWRTFNRTRSISKQAFWQTTRFSWPAYGAAGIRNNSNGGGYAIGVDGSNYSSMDTAIILETPFIDVSSLWKPTLSFDSFMNNINSPDNQTLFVDLFNGVKWLRSIDTINTNDSTWVISIVPLDNLFSQDIIKIRFRVDKTTANIPYYSDVLIDNVRINDLDCNKPDSLTSTALNKDSVELRWYSSNSNSFSILEYGPSGFLRGTGTTLITQSPAIIGGLKPILYDFYVQDTCGGDTTPYVGPEHFLPDTSSIGLYDFQTGRQLVLVYPNPVSDLLTIQGLNSNHGSIKIEILDISGRTVRTSNLKNEKAKEEISVDLTILAPGVYFLKARCKEETFETRFIKH